MKLLLKIFDIFEYGYRWRRVEGNTGRWGNIYLVVIDRGMCIRLWRVSDQGGDEEDQGKESGDVGLVEHGADDGSGCFVNGDVLGGGLEGEAEDDQQGDDEILHNEINISSTKSISNLHGRYAHSSSFPFFLTPKPFLSLSAVKRSPFWTFLKLSHIFLSYFIVITRMLRDYD